MPRSLDQWLAHQSQVHPQAIDMGLRRLGLVLERLRWRQPAVPVITVAGTNGKGSVTAYCAAILGAAGLRPGVFTSPHLRDYRERIRIGERLVTSAELTSSFERIEAACRLAPEISLTFFEYNAAAAFLIFEAAGVDAWILEVGLGGRLDAVNVVDPSVAVVVSIGLDHQEYLGDTCDAIAREKAGILRRGRVAVLGTDLPALNEAAVRAGAVLKRRGVEFDAVTDVSGWRYRGPRWDVPALPAPALAGATQVNNAAIAIAALEALEATLPVSPQALAAGLREVRLVGRFQVIPVSDAPTWILDVAHNPEAARVLAENLKEGTHRGRTFAVCGILADKDAAGVAAHLRDSFDAWWLTPTDGARGTSAEDLAARIRAHVSAPLTLAAAIGPACAAARAAAVADDRIVVFGSFHTVGPALDWLESQGLLPVAPLPEYTAALPGQ